jgi:hypothetical protein
MKLSCTWTRRGHVAVTESRARILSEWQWINHIYICHCLLASHEQSSSLVTVCTSVRVYILSISHIYSTLNAHFCPHRLLCIVSDRSLHTTLATTNHWLHLYISHFAELPPIGLLVIGECAALWTRGLYMDRRSYNQLSVIYDTPSHSWTICDTSSQLGDSA